MSGGDQAYDERIAREGSQKVGKGKRHHFNYFSPQYLWVPNIRRLILQELLWEFTVCWLELHRWHRSLRALSWYIRSDWNAYIQKQTWPIEADIGTSERARITPRVKQLLRDYKHWGQKYRLSLSSHYASGHSFCGVLQAHPTADISHSPAGQTYKKWLLHR
jgi:hypothetical protein